MVGKETSADRSSSLARLRQFLAPHAPKSAKKDEAPQSDLESSTPQVQINGKDLATTAESSGVVDSAISHNSEQTSGRRFGMEQQTTRKVDDTQQSKSDVEATRTEANGFSQLCQLSQSSIEYARVKYLLQCSLPGRQVAEKVTVVDIQSPDSLVQYTRNVSGLLEIDSWVSVHELGIGVSEMLHTGFNQLVAGAQMTKFITGIFHSNNEETSYSLDKGAEQQLLLCKIAIGRSLVISEEHEAQQVLPPGYHSFHLLQKSCEGSDSILSDYSHKYILPNVNRILPQYLVSFQTTKLGGTHLGGDICPIKKCGMCESIIATVACMSCGVHLCECCDNQVHTANKIVSRHVRSLISETRDSQQEMTQPGDTVSISKLLSDGLARSEVENSKCSSHPDKQAEFFCPRCDRPMCVNCKVLGDHSAGDKGSHRLLTVAEAYEACLRDALRPDPLLDSRRSVLDSKLSALQTLAESVKNNKQRVREAIEAQYRQALDQLDANVRDKLNALDSEIYEYKRQSQQLDWVNASLERNRVLLGPIEFLNAWKQHKKLQAEHHEYPSLTAATDFNSADQIKPDLELVGTLHVVSTGRASNGGTNSQDGNSRSKTPSVRELHLERASLSTLDDSERVQAFASMTGFQLRDSPPPSRPLSPTYHRVMEEIAGSSTSPSRAPPRPGSACPSPVGAPLTPTHSRVLPLTPGKSTILAAPTPDKLATLRGMTLRRKSSGSSFNNT